MQVTRNRMSVLCSAVGAALVALVLAAGLGASEAWAAPADQTQKALTVSQPMQAAASSECTLAKASSGSITWNASTETVTMTNATIDLSNQGDYIYNAIYADGRDASSAKTITLNLVGNNTILNENGGSYTTFVSIDNASLRITGSGTLTMKGNATATAFRVDGAFTAPSGKIAITNFDDGIWADGTVTLNGSTVEIRDTDSYAIYSSDKNVVLSGGTVTVANTEYGVWGKTGVAFSGAQVAVTNSLYHAVHSSASVDVSAGSLTATNCREGISAFGAYTQTGGTVTASSITNDGVSGWSVTVRGGTLNVSSDDDALYSSDGATVISGGTITLSAEYSGISAYGTSGAVTISGGTVTINGCKYGINPSTGYTQTGGTVSIRSNTITGVSCTSFTLRNGTLGVSGGSTGVYSSGAMTVSGGTLTISGCDDGISGPDSMRVSNGKITVNACKEGIYSYGPTTISGGTVSVTNVDDNAIHSGKKLTISGGAVTAKCKTASKYALYSYSGGISNKVASLKAINGQIVGKGATFVVGGSTYVAHDWSTYVTLKSYGGSSKKPTVNTVAYGGFTYGVRGIESKAFSTKKGKAITALTLGANVREIKANAFAGTTKLTTINIKKFPYYMGTIAKTAFKKCGKSNGAKVTFKCASKYDRKAARKLLLKKGVSKKAKFK